LQQSCTVFDTAGEEEIHIQRLNFVNRRLLQMKTSIIIIVLLFSGGVASASLANLLRLSEFMAAIYRQFPRGCIFIIDSEAEQGENEFYIM
jgi:ubiquinone biosynthesis protein Coq4